MEQYVFPGRIFLTLLFGIILITECITIISVQSRSENEYCIISFSISLYDGVCYVLTLAPLSSTPTILCAIYIIYCLYKWYITWSLVRIQVENQLVSAALKNRSAHSSAAPLEIDSILLFQRAFTDKVNAFLGIKGLKLDCKGLQMAERSNLIVSVA